MKTWFITGAGRGLGRAFARAALDRGDNVVATARSAVVLRDLDADRDRLLRVPLDVTDPTAVTAAVGAATAHFGTLDVIVNNAAGGARGAVEELSDAQLRESLEINFFGALAVTRAVLPLLRAQGHGHIVQVSSLGGLIGLPLAGGYAASKWALEGITESLAQEAAPLGIAVTLVEPGPFATDQGRGAGTADPWPAYQHARDAQDAHSMPTPRDPAEAAQALLRLVDLPEPPLRLVLGDGLEFVEQVYAGRLAGWRAAAAQIAEPAVSPLP